ncbi:MULTISPECIES: RNA polymerase sigma-70 factor [unclassified Cupriavidus]|uniref:RNA polymerase sigma-70 factor n=1 Tax=unclassified Cupriavidus TaxID=2640874 RepID=UPI001C0059DD|nr:MULTISPECIES: RNA polymerase sigma-70 factor [unclassified Cupriavidus]MCA3184370.1 RNA polymerase sigma-70 factor [Cupriavidus sp.]MCA3189612.1 RNA polymerase sigma-70 factor [Cupriavidus sp.]MCA3195750.1 RNA polymerase sigma-70 factor [Cupriavidus sp.]MCA3203908.1 RNA polymerase sigma-70 factor [Cupriavidus sp.]MCA3206132.1 RNA polymerase sigma-70 factor [Cupriavidus sp.]
MAAPEPAPEPAPASDSTQTFDQLRPRLHGIAYRMLGAVAEAEDVVQDAWLRWHGTDRAAIDNTEAWLVSVTTRLAIDHLRAAKLQREHYAGIWLPEPLLSDSTDSPEAIQERADDVSVAYLFLLERLTPEARAAFLLREVFDADYAEVASIIGKSESACRQLVSRARTQLRDGRPAQPVRTDAHQNLVRRFAQALEQGSFDAIRGLLADEATLIGDGGGKVPSFPKPLVGGGKIAQLYFTAKRRGQTVHVQMVVLNGQWSLLRFIDGQLESAQTYVTDGERIVGIQAQRNPDKLQRILATISRP